MSDTDARPTGSARPAEPDRPPTFEQALAELGDLVTRLESGGLGLSESIAAYERGVALLRRLHDELATAEQKVSVLVRIDEHGRPVVEDHGPAAGDVPVGDAPQAPGRRGRSARSRSLPGMDDEG